MRVRHLFWILTAAIGFALPAWAGTGGSPVPPVLSGATKNDDKAYVGIQWDMNVRNSATVVLGYRSAKVGSDDKVHGAAAEVTFALTGPLRGPGEIRIKGFDGKRKSQGELGVGYSLLHRAFLLNAGVQGNHVYGGVDYLFGPGFKPYVGVNTLGRHDAVSQTATCPNGYVLVGPSCELDD